MNDVFVRYSEELPYGVHGMVMPDENGDYNIYINPHLSIEKRNRAAKHEMAHIRNGNFDNGIPVDCRKENKAKMKKFAVTAFCICLCFAMCGCEIDNAAGSVKPSATCVDTNSNDYQAGFEAGEKSVQENPEDYGLISEENAEEYVEDQIDPEEAEQDFQDAVQEYVEDNGYHK